MTKMLPNHSIDHMGGQTRFLFNQLTFPELLEIKLP